jgi:hypothetical protein
MDASDPAALSCCACSQHEACVECRDRVGSPRRALEASPPAENPSRKPGLDSPSRPVGRPGGCQLKSAHQHQQSGSVRLPPPASDQTSGSPAGTRSSPSRHQHHGDSQQQRFPLPSPLHTSSFLAVMSHLLSAHGRKCCRTPPLAFRSQAMRPPPPAPMPRQKAAVVAVENEEGNQANALDH